MSNEQGPAAKGVSVKLLSTVDLGPEIEHASLPKFEPKVKLGAAGAASAGCGG